MARREDNEKVAMMTPADRIAAAYGRFTRHVFSTRLLETPADAGGSSPIVTTTSNSIFFDRIEYFPAKLANNRRLQRILLDLLDYFTAMAISFSLAMKLSDTLAGHRSATPAVLRGQPRISANWRAQHAIRVREERAADRKIGHRRGWAAAVPSSA